jgi:hypothetical protein
MSLLMLNFGTFRETNIFANDLQHQGFALFDSTNGSKTPGFSLDRVKGPTEVYTLFRIDSQRWTGTAPSRTFAKAFGAWMQSVVDAEPEVAYLTGHHAQGDRRTVMTVLANDWPEDRIRFAAGFTADGRTMSFAAPADLEQVARVDLAGAKRNCRLVVGFGCSVARPDFAQFYQRVFSAGAERSIVLGWDRTMSIPRSGEGSVNSTFFRELTKIPDVEGSSIGEVCRRWPAQVVAAWGTAVATFHGGKPGDNPLFAHAAARDAQGMQYRFEIANGRATPRPT